MIFVTPYSMDKDLGSQYNKIMSMAQETVCFTDGDTMFLTPDFGHIIQYYHNLYPEAVLTCKTNRIHPLSKQLDGSIDNLCDIRMLISRAEARKHVKTVTEIMPGEAMSGLLMVVPFSVWQKVKFVENKGLLGIDSQFRKDLHAAGIKIFIMDGVFIFHQYRLINGIQYKKHLL